MSSSDKRNRSAGDDESSDNWTYKSNDMESQSYFGKLTSESSDFHGVTIRDITDRHVENFLEAIEHELVDKMMKKFTEKIATAINENQAKIFELQQKHEHEQNHFEDELLKLNKELTKNAAELEDFIAIE